MLRTLDPKYICLLQIRQQSQTCTRLEESVVLLQTEISTIKELLKEIKDEAEKPRTVMVTHNCMWQHKHRMTLTGADIYIVLQHMSMRIVCIVSNCFLNRI